MSDAINQTQGKYIKVPREAYSWIQSNSEDRSAIIDFLEALAEEATPRIDNKVRYFGTDRDVGMYYDGTDFYIKTDYNNPSDLIIDCGTEKTLELAESVYDDLPPVPILAAKLGSTAPTLTTFVGNIEQYTFDATNDFVIGSTEITHKYKEGTDISIHIHWATNGVDVTDRGVKWQLEYSIGDASEAFGAAVTVSAEDQIPANTPDRTHLIAGLGDITGTNLKIGAYITWRLNRIASVTDPAPSADPFCIAVGFHIEQDTIGSRQVFIK